MGFFFKIRFQKFSNWHELTSSHGNKSFRRMPKTELCVQFFSCFSVDCATIYSNWHSCISVCIQLPVNSFGKFNALAFIWGQVVLLYPRIVCVRMSNFVVVENTRSEERRVGKECR